MSFLQQKCISTFNETDLGYYLAGLIEGDGYFGKANLQIVYHLKDQIAAQKLQKAIGFGQLSLRKNSQAVALTIWSKKGLKRVLDLTKGKFVGPFKINQLQNHGYEKILNIKILSATELVSFENAWLAGFFEADGSINICLRNRSKTSLIKRTDVSLSFAQKNPFLLSIIATLFENQKVRPKISKATLTRPAYHGSQFAVTSRKNLPLWFHYFRRFHLQGRKYFQILMAEQCFNLLIQKKHLTQEGLIEVLILQEKLRNAKLE